MRTIGTFIFNGIALRLTGQMFDTTFARAVQRGMQYDPAPPYQAEV